MNIKILDTKNINPQEIINLYKANQWTAADKPEKLYNALMNSQSLISAWNDNNLIGIGNAISDNYLVVYYPHLLVHPDYQGQGIGQMIMAKMQEKYKDFHMQILVADENSTNFYQKLGFERAGSTESMWIYKGDEH